MDFPKITHYRSKLTPKVNRYSHGDTLCLGFIEDTGEEYITLSTNLKSKHQSNDKIFIRQDGSHIEIAESLVKLGYLKETDIFEKSGYCNYRLYETTSLLGRLVGRESN